MFIQKDKEFINLALVKKFEVYERIIIFYFDLERDERAKFTFESNEKTKHYLNTIILPLLMKNLPR